MLSKAWATRHLSSGCFLSLIVHVKAQNLSRYWELYNATNVTQTWSQPVKGLKNYPRDEWMNK